MSIMRRLLTRLRARWARLTSRRYSEHEAAQIRLRAKSRL